MYLKTKTAKCPECGAILRISNSNEISECIHCNTPILIKIDNILPFYIIKSSFQTGDSTGIMLSRLKHYLIANDFIARSRILSRTLYYVPFIFTTGYRCQEHIIEERDRLTSEKREDTRIILSTFKSILPAAKLPDWGTIKIDSEHIFSLKDKLEPFKDDMIKNGIILRPDLSIVPEKELYRHFITHNENIQTEIIIENCILIYYPIIRVVLKYRNNIYHYSIDGLNGKILYGIAPESENNRFIPMITAAFFTALFAGGIIKFLINTVSGGVIFLPIYFLPILGTFLVVLFIFIYIAWIFYRNYGEVVIENNKIEINKLNIPDKTYIEKLLEPLFAYIEQIINYYRRRNL